MASVLLVEDREDVRELLKETILTVGHTLVCAPNWAEGLRTLATGMHDVLVADVRLPDGSGHDLAQRALSRGTKAILISGHPDEMRQSPGIIYLRKPFLMRALLNALERHVGPSPLPPPPTLVGVPRPDRPLSNPFAAPPPKPTTVTTLGAVLAPDIAALQPEAVDGAISAAPSRLQ